MNTAIILAAGASARAGQDKLWANIYGRPLWTLSYEAFRVNKNIHKIILVVPASKVALFKKYISKNTKLVIGGKSRMESFKNALKKIKFQKNDIIIDHNAANPFPGQFEINAVVKEAKKHGAAASSISCTDTVIESKGSCYGKVIKRETLRLMQTPQAVRGDVLNQINLKNETDLCGALLNFTKVKIVPASPANKKITYAEDIVAASANSYLGEDSHKFGKSGVLTLGGLKINNLPSLKANSDGDVILHAIGRALAQARDKNFSGFADKLCAQGTKNSRAYLRTLQKNIRIERLSITLECKKPKIDGLPLKKSLAKILKLPSDKIHISAHTGEGLTAFGKGEGIRCAAILTCL